MSPSPYKSKTRSGHFAGHRVRIEEATTPTDGETTPTWSTLVRGTSVPCHVIERTGNEHLFGNQVEATVTSMVRMSYRSDVTPRMRLVYGSRNLNIVSATDPTGRGLELTIMCKEVQS